jgi:hypothetical protein
MSIQPSNGVYHIFSLHKFLWLKREKLLIGRQLDLVPKSGDIVSNRITIQGMYEDRVFVLHVDKNRSRTHGLLFNDQSSDGTNILLWYYPFDYKLPVHYQEMFDKRDGLK